MKTNELMIGDKVAVRSNDGHDLHILSVSEVKSEGISSGKQKVFFAYDEIEPIPLTVEILEKNRWFEIFKDKYEGNISLAKEETTCFRIKNTNLCLRFVHELQHALRLYKLNEVADKLKC